MRIGIVVQARLGSTRLPAKVLLPAPDRRPLLAVMLERLDSLLEQVDVGVVATTTKSEDTAILDIATSCGWQSYAGPEQDVLARYVEVCEQWRLDAVVRLTGDCPLVDPSIVRYAIEVWKSCKNKTYLSLSPRWPDGMDTEIITAELLRESMGSPLASDHEHVTQYARRQLGIPICPIEPEELGFKNLDDRLRLTIDEWPDYALICEILARLGNDCTLQQITQLAKRRPWLFKGNWWIERNAGLRESLEAEQRSNYSLGLMSHA